MSEAKVARVYAGSLFEAASELGKLTAVHKDFSEFIKALEEAPTLSAFFYDVELAEEKKKHLLMQLTEGGSTPFRNFLKLLVDKRREEILPLIWEVFDAMAEAQAGVVKVDMVTARPVPDSMRDEIRKTLESSMNKAVELTMTVDEQILGGVLLRTGDRIADASIRLSLDRLRNRLVNPTARLEGSVEAAS